MTLASLQAIFFDFDGVLVESVNIKTEAFCALYAEYGEKIVALVKAHHLAHGGMSRFNKFSHYHNIFLQQPLTGEQLNDLAQRFSTLVENGVIATPWVSGAKETLERLHIRLPLFVVSGTPDNELHRIIEQRKMAHYFVSTHGSPRNKITLLNEILQTHGYDPAHCLMIGDSMEDYMATIPYKMPFLGRVPLDQSNSFPDSIPVITDFQEVHPFLQ